MKRNTYCILIVLFLLSACVPIPKGLDQAATATHAGTSIPIPTVLPTYEPTKMPSFAKVFPPTIQRCKIENDVLVVNMEEGIEKILAMEEALGLTTEDAAGGNKYIIQASSKEIVVDQAFSRMILADGKHY